MSLHTRARLGFLHPWVADRIRYILDYADNWNPTYSITSGYRTAQEQWALYQDPNSPAARVGCSQHQYGLAADVKFERQDWQNWYLDSARRLGLSTVSGDPVHVQAIPGVTFAQLSRAEGLCPDVYYHPYTRDRSVIDAYCGANTFATSLEITRKGIICRGGHWNVQGIYPGE